MAFSKEEMAKIDENIALVEEYLVDSVNQIEAVNMACLYYAANGRQYELTVNEERSVMITLLSSDTRDLPPAQNIRELDYDNKCMVLESWPNIKKMANKKIETIADLKKRRKAAIYDFKI